MAAIVGANTPLSETEHRTQLNRAVIASTIGTTIEWYDFFLYSTVTGLVFAKLYFPHSDPLVGTLASVRHLRRRLRRPPGRGRDLRPLRRPHRPQVDVDRDPAADGHGDLSRRLCPDLRADRHLGRGDPDRAALHPGRRRRRRMGRLGVAVDGMGAQPTSIAASSRPGRNSACRRGCSSPISRCWRSARSRATSSWSGAGASRSCSASSWSAIGLYIRLGILETPAFARLVAENRIETRADARGDQAAARRRSS